MKLSARNLAFAALAAALASGLYLFGFAGLRALAAIVLFFFVPFFLILRRFDFPADERVFFAFFIGIAFFSTAVFYFGRVIPSYRVATAAAFVFLLLLPFAMRKLKK